MFHRAVKPLLSLVISFALVATIAIAGLADQPPVGQITPLASVPAAPGFPEGVVVHGNYIFVSGAATFGTAGKGPSAVQVFDRKTGSHVTTISVAGENLALEHALSNIAVDGEGRIYALSTQLGLLRFTRQGDNYTQETYGTLIPDLPRCADAAPGGPAPQILFQSQLFEGGGFFPFGTNGIRLDPGRGHVYIAVSTYSGAPNVGTIYRLPLVSAPVAAQLEVFHEYTFSEVPDQLAFDSNGKLYVSLALSNQISVLAPDGAEVTRYQSAPGDAIPLDAPAGIAFDSRSKSLLIVNHA